MKCELVQGLLCSFRYPIKWSCIFSSSILYTSDNTEIGRLLFTHYRSGSKTDAGMQSVDEVNGIQQQVYNEDRGESR